MFYDVVIENESMWQRAKFLRSASQCSTDMTQRIDTSEGMGHFLRCFVTGRKNSHLSHIKSRVKVKFIVQDKFPVFTLFREYYLFIFIFDRPFISGEYNYLHVY